MIASTFGLLDKVGVQVLLTLILTATQVSAQTMDCTTNEGTTKSPFEPISTGSVDLQTQLYIICGVFGGVVLLLLILVLGLALSMAKLKDQISNSMERYSVDGTKLNRANQPIMAFDNNAYNSRPEVDRNHASGMRERSVDGEEELEQLGYSVYTGNRNNTRRGQTWEQTSYEI